METIQRPDSTIQDRPGLYLDRPLPFLVVARQHGEEGDALIRRLAATQAAFLLADDEEAAHETVAAVAADMHARFGTFLVVELWAGPPPERGPAADTSRLRPGFRLLTPKHERLAGTAEALGDALGSVTLHKQPAHIHTTSMPQPAPFEHAPLQLGADGHVIGLEVTPVYCDPATGAFFPVVFEKLRRQFADALKQGLFHFVRTCTREEPPHPLALGPRTLEDVAQEIDHTLADLDASFDFLLQTTPVNAQQAWAAFEESGFALPPVFHYRPLPVDPDRLKRRLFELPLERVNDPLLAHIFREKQEEIDRKLTMLRERDTRAFFLGSLQLFGEVQPDLLELAEGILERLPVRDRDRASSETLSAAAFARSAREEFTHYRKRISEFPQAAELRDDIPPGVMVSRGRLLIGAETRVPAARVEALLQHEVGTHMVTYYNGRRQPLRLLHTGLAGYEALQEGLAVLAEYLTGGLTVPRLRVLAARVIASHCLIEGADFHVVFRRLTQEHSFDPKTAFSVTMRTFRGGGFIKDVIYLRGLLEVTNYLRAGGDLEPLFVGKLALHHLDFIEELHHRGVLQPVPLRPRFLDQPQAPDRLERLKSGLTYIDLVNPAHPS